MRLMPPTPKKRADNSLADRELVTFCFSARGTVTRRAYAEGTTIVNLVY